MQPQTVIPQLRVTDARRSLEFYVNGLGFAVDWEHQFEPGFPLFMQLTRSGQTIFLTEHTGDCEVGGAVYFVVPDVNRCFAEFSARGVLMAEPPADTHGELAKCWPKTQMATAFALRAKPLPPRPVVATQMSSRVAPHRAPNLSVKGTSCAKAQAAPYLER